jgi:hypothetical protein
MVALAQQYADQVTANSQTVQQTFIQFVNTSWARIYDLMWKSFQNDLAEEYISQIVTTSVTQESIAALPGPQVISPVDGSVTTTSWAPNTAYVAGAIVQNFSSVVPNLAGSYICATPGTSGTTASGATGPQGNSNGQVDGTTGLTWNYFPAFFKLLLVQAQLLGQYWQPLEKFELSEIDLDKYYGGYLFYSQPWARYCPLGQYKLYIQPSPPTAPTLKIRYIPVCPPLVYLTDWVDCIYGWDEAVELDAAIQARIKEQNEVTDLVARRDEAMARILTGAPNRNADRAFRMIRRGGNGWGNGYI